MDIVKLNGPKVLLNEQEGQKTQELSKQQALAELTAHKRPHKILYCSSKNHRITESQNENESSGDILHNA